MEDKPSGNTSRLKKISHSTGFWILIGLVGMVVLFFIMLPVGIDYGIERYLKDQGADQATLADVDFNPFTGRMAITDLTVTIGTQTVLNIPKAVFKIQWTPLIRKRFVLDRFTISDTKLIVEEMEDGRWQIGGIRLPDKSDSPEPSVWSFSFREAAVNNSKVKFISSRLTSDLTIEQAKISKLTSWMQADRAQLEFTGQLNDARMQLQMDVSPFGSDIMVAGKIKLNGLTLNPFRPLLQPHIETLEGRLDIDVSIETRQAADSGISHFQKGLVKLYQVNTQIADMNLSKNDLVWDGAIRVEIPKSEEALKISTDGQLHGSGISLNIENENLKLQQDNVSWKGKISYTQDNSSQKINTDGQIGLVDLKMESPALNLIEEKLTWAGTLQFSSKAENIGQRIIADGALDGKHLQVSLPKHKLKFEHQGSSWKGRLDSGEQNDFSTLRVEGDVIFKDIHILHSGTNHRLLNANQFDLQTIKVESLDKVNISSITLNGLALLADLKSAPSASEEPPLLRLQEAKLKDVKLTQQKDLAIDVIHLKALNAFAHRNRAGKWTAFNRWDAVQKDVFATDQADRVGSGTKVKKKSDEFGFRIGQVDIAGYSGLQFKDESVSPAFGIDLGILKASLSELNTRQPERPTSVKLLLSDKENARLSLDGTLQPFAEKLSLDWVGKIESLELPPLSPYVIQKTGYRFISGEIEADIPIKINRNQLEGKIDLILYKPKVERTKTEKPPEEKQGKIRLNMSLDSALKLMRDKQNNVKINIPLSGDISDPQFSVAEAVNKVLAKTLQTSALSYLKYMLGPYGIGISVAEFAYKRASKIRLNPILFEPGSTELDEPAIDYLKRVSAIMEEHTATRLDVCGVATESDRAAQKELSASTTTDDILFELAKSRTERIKEQLVKLHGIAIKRLITCEPKIDKSAGAKPRVNLEI